MYAIFTFNKQTPFPGLYALIPTAGTALVIIFAVKGTLVNLVLGNKFLMGLGLVSYSAYLWHYPLFAFSRYRTHGEISQIVMGLLCFLTISLAYFSWRFIEKPFRSKTSINRKFVFSFSAFGCAGFIIFGIIGYQAKGFRSRLPMPPNVSWMSFSDKLDVEGDVCVPLLNTKYKGLSTCEFGNVDSDQVIVLYGDSHGQSISRVLNQEMIELGYKVIKVDTGCGVIPEIISFPVGNPREKYDYCNNKFSEVKRLISDYQASVLLVTRWTFQYFPLEGFVDALPFDNGVGGVEKINYRESVALLPDGDFSFGPDAKRKATVNLLRGLAEASKNLFVVYPIPEVGWDIFKVNAEYYKGNNKILDSLYFPYKRYQQRNKFVLQILQDELGKTPNAIPIRADLIFCSDIISGSCVAQKDGVPLYYDDDHLSDSGARLLVNDFAKRLSDRETQRGFAPANAAM